MLQQKVEFELTDQFWAMHYPGGEIDEQSLDFHEVRSRLDGLLKLIAGLL